MRASHDAGFIVLLYIILLLSVGPIRGGPGAALRCMLWPSVVDIVWLPRAAVLWPMHALVVMRCAVLRQRVRSWRPVLQPRGVVTVPCPLSMPLLLLLLLMMLLWLLLLLLLPSLLLILLWVKLKLLRLLAVCGTVRRCGSMVHKCASLLLRRNPVR